MRARARACVCVCEKEKEKRCVKMFAYSEKDFYWTENNFYFMIIDL